MDIRNFSRTKVPNCEQNLGFFELSKKNYFNESCWSTKRCQLCEYFTTQLWMLLQNNLGSPPLRSQQAIPISWHKIKQASKSSHFFNIEIKPKVLKPSTLKRSREKDTVSCFLVNNNHKKKLFNVLNKKLFNKKLFTWILRIGPKTSVSTELHFFLLKVMNNNKYLQFRLQAAVKCWIPTPWSIPEASSPSRRIKLLAFFSFLEKHKHQQLCSISTLNMKYHFQK